MQISCLFGQIELETGMLTSTNHVFMEIPAHSLTLDTTPRSGYLPGQGLGLAIFGGCGLPTGDVPIYVKSRDVVTVMLIVLNYKIITFFQ